MKKLCLFAVLILTLSFMQAQKVQDKLVRMLPAFSSLNIESGFVGNVILCQSSESKSEIAVESEDHNAEYIAFTVKNGELTLSIKEHPQNCLELKVSYIKIYSPNFHSVTSKGTGNITIENRLSGDNFTLDVSGPGNTKINELQMRNNIVITTKSAGNLNIKKCQADDAVIQLGGAGNFEVAEIGGITPNNKVTINIGGAGNMVIGNVAADKLFLKKRSAGNLVLKDVSANEFRLKNDGTGNVKVTGNVVDVDIYNGGVGNFNTAGLTAEIANVVNNGINVIHLKVQDTAYISGEVVTAKDIITNNGVVKISGPAKVFQKVPFFDAETGEEIGEQEIQIK
ncbi:MAG: DUF2807 domain-containing protein [Bacteroidales bacterium]|nr:DUF2807 domain-containing protein [Bacteroidales bacterium]